jgi:hypothetical protein
MLSKITIKCKEEHYMTATYPDDTIRFNVAISDCGAVTVAFELFCDEQWNDDVEDTELEALPDSVKWHRVYSAYVSDQNIDDTIATLVDCGYIYNPKVFMWYMPSQLAFTFQDKNVVYMEPIPAACDFACLLPENDDIAPEDRSINDLPYSTDLRDYMIFGCSASLGDNGMENTFNFPKSMAQDAVIDKLKSAGFTYNPDL